jgi:hypothetical protein
MRVALQAAASLAHGGPAARPSRARACGLLKVSKRARVRAPNARLSSKRLRFPCNAGAAARRRRAYLAAQSAGTARRARPDRQRERPLQHERHPTRTRPPRHRWPDDRRRGRRGARTNPPRRTAPYGEGGGEGFPTDAERRPRPRRRGDAWRPANSCTFHLASSWGSVFTASALPLRPLGLGALSRCMGSRSEVGRRSCRSSSLGAGDPRRAPAGMLSSNRPD